MESLFSLPTHAVLNTTIFPIAVNGELLLMIRKGKLDCTAMEMLALTPPIHFNLTIT